MILVHNWIFICFDFRYWDSLQAVIWPRFELVFRLNIQSIHDCDPTKFNKELGPHYVSIRFKVSTGYKLS